VGRPLESPMGTVHNVGRYMSGETVVYDREGNTRRRFSSVRYFYASDICGTHHWHVLENPVR
jgi:hypothetical protein